MAQIAAVDRPERCAGLVLTNAIAYDSWPIPSVQALRATSAVLDRLPDLQVPARIVWGLADQFQKARYGERLARDLGTRAVGMPGGKHFTPEDHPATVASAIRGLVTEVEG